MPPKRSPPLPRSLFTSGPLAPGAISHPPSPSTVHPEFITDAHNDGSFLVLKNDAEKTKPPVTGSISVVAPGVAVSLPGLLVPSSDPNAAPKAGLQLTRTATIMDPDAGVEMEHQSPEPALDLVIPNTVPLTETQWDHLDDIVNAVDGGWGNHESDPTKPPRKILISGLLPPPLSKASSPLLQSNEYNLYLARLAQLSLHADVALKALPPVADSRAVTGDWWKDPKELERVVKMYVAPAIETFGTHRIIFGSQPALSPKDAEVACPARGEDWYFLLRKCVSELGEDSAAMTHVMGSNAVEAYTDQR